MKKIKQCIRESLLIQKFLWMIGIIFVYLVGLNIPLFTVPLNDEFLSNTFGDILTNLAMVSGGKLSSLTLFSLGLSPWMTSMILWRGLTLFRFSFLENLSKKQLHVYKTLLTITVAIIQAFGFTIGATYVPVISTGTYPSDLVYRWITIAILVTGALVLNWLADVNTNKGLGGASVILLVNMMMNLSTNIYQFITENTHSWLTVLFRILLMAVIFSLLSFVVIYTYRGEYRIPMKRISVHNQYSQDTYLPIRINPAGGMPFMYGMTLLIYPPLIIRSLLHFFPEQEFLLYLSRNTALSTLPGILIYLSLLYILSIGFTYFNYDPETIAKDLRNSGDYIEHIRPGRETQIFLQRKIAMMAQIGAFIVCMIGGVPLFFSIGQTETTNITLLFGTIFVVVSLTLMINEQVEIMRIFKQYKPILETHQ